MTKNVEFAPIGLTQMYNSGGSVDEIDCSSKNSDFSLRIKGKGSGIFGAYSSRRPEICTLNSKQEEFQFSSTEFFDIEYSWRSSVLGAGNYLLRMISCSQT
ncbi:putative galactinol--sucrose galactosyltransferase 1 [Platanthera guangdongensis]|uniref:Galactinol--sucrose galactosyltransferase 1 n=1 Tax=Platanthera guangdongensis TaxID=2320717 RepID=A0ABR2LFL1_9ASPA